MTALSYTIESLKLLLGDRAITPSNPSYASTQSQPWSQTCWQAASCYALLQTAEEVSVVLQIIKDTECPFSVRAAGHNPNPGFSSADETAIVLDLGLLQEKSLSDDREIANAGAGCRWGDIYGWLEEQGLSVIGGRDPTVGMGLLLGGGYGAVPNLYGIPADNVENFEVVLSDGKVVNANPTENTDLFQALKGGGSNFGIVTRYDLKSHPLIPLQYSIKLYSPEDYTNINAATLNLQHEMETDPNIGLFTNYNPGFVAVGIAYANYINTEVNNLDAKHFGGLDSLINTACPRTNGTVLSLSNIMAHNVSDIKKRYVGTLTTRCTETLYNNVYRAWSETLPAIPDNAVLHYTIQPVGTGCVEQGEAQGGNILGLEKGAQCWWVFTIEWPDTNNPASDHAARKAVDTLIQRIKTSAVSRGELLDCISANFAGPRQDVLRSYGEENYKKIRDVAREYDPEGVFQRQQLGGFLLRGLDEGDA